MEQLLDNISDNEIQLRIEQGLRDADKKNVRDWTIIKQNFVEKIKASKKQ